MSRHQDDIVVVDAGQVTLKGTPQEVDDLAAAAGLYGEPANPRRMSNDEDHIMTGVYIGLGILLAAGAGYLAWRYALSDEQKRKAINTTKDLLADGTTMARRAVRDARDKVHV
ncbi:MAG: hypothetical protein QOC71_1022 [Thermoplasmata archaeon]|jgi:hypothetical protein|nr:hypothetical protein [Thermoplasmata archaeon]